ncbi:hypothetical protein ABT187_08735 [Streptomyces sp. NPDC001817]|uniref:hypothetical protein n=1 Tax=Streptomyces sp. NPDC001817 TaxID=3154398 RepID=UPI00332E60F0
MPSSIPKSAPVLLAAAAVGVLGPLFEEMNGQAGQIISVTLSAGWAYAAVAYFAGMVCTTKRGATALGVVSLWVSVVAYYVTKAAQGDYQRADLSDTSGKTEYFAWGELLQMIGLWCVVACLLGAVCAVAGNFSRTGPYRFPSQLLLPLVIVAETTLRLAYPAPLQDQLAVTTWQVTRVAAIVAVVALAVMTVWRRNVPDRTS